jgi:hypothetical protein
MRHVLIDLFDREFIVPQEALARKNSNHSSRMPALRLSRISRASTARTLSRRFQCAKVRTFSSGSRTSTIQLHTNFTSTPWLDLGDGAARFPKNWHAVSNERRKY